MTNKIEISRELAERLTKDYTGRPNWDALEEDRLAATEELRALLAAPAVERQEPVAAGCSKCNKGFVCIDWEAGQWGDCPDCKSTKASPPAPVAVVLPRYTCIGKGGEYELLGNAIGAGTLKDMSAIPVYRDTTTGQLFVRTPLEFQTRMESLDKVKEMNKRENES